jgi:effector-binding domain-containing protein
MTRDRLSDYQFVELEPQPSVAVRLVRPMADLDIGVLLDRELPRLSDAIQSAEGEWAGPPYIRYFMFGPDQADIEIGIPVEEPLDIAPSGDERPAASELPGGRAARVLHTGPYDTLGQAYDALPEWIGGQGEAVGDGPWESYVDNPSEAEDMERVKTSVFWPVG